MTALAIYLIAGSGMAWLCGVRGPVHIAITAVFWPVIAAIVLIDMAGKRGGEA